LRISAKNNTGQYAVSYGGRLVDHLKDQSSLGWWGLIPITRLDEEDVIDPLTEGAVGTGSLPENAPSDRG
jgi:hypothetical protein